MPTVQSSWKAAWLRKRLLDPRGNRPRKQYAPNLLGTYGRVDHQAPRPMLIVDAGRRHPCRRSEELTSELQSLMRISYAVFCLKKKKKRKKHIKTIVNYSHHR